MPAILERWEVMPHGPLVALDEGLLSVAGEIAMPLGRFPRRMTVVALNRGRTAIYSAVALDDAGNGADRSDGPPGDPDRPQRLASHGCHDLEGTLSSAPRPDAAWRRGRVAKAVRVDATIPTFGRSSGTLDDRCQGPAAMRAR